jgi:phosphotriesterase-related protein
MKSEHRPTVTLSISKLTEAQWEEADMNTNRFTRREVLHLLGIATLGVGAGCGQTPESPPTESPPTDSQPPASVTFPDGAVIRAILEDLSPESLGSGATLFHEHLSLNVAFWETLLGGNPEALAQRLSGSPPSFFMEDFDLILEEVRAAAEDGLACIVDGGHADMGRDIDFLRRLSQESGLPIVASGGYYLQPFYPAEIADQDAEEIAEALVQGAQEERWGAFGEIGSSAEMTPDEEKMLGAVGRAHLQTNIPIFTHTANGAEALKQLDILEGLGIDPAHFVIGHLGSLPDPEVEVHTAVAARGAFIGFDRLASGPESDAVKVEMITAMLDAGYVDNLLLASDFASAEHLKRNGGAGYAKTVTEFVPMLREAGVDDETIRTMTVDNPRRFLAFVPRT